MANVLLRNTLFGQCLRYVGVARLPHTDEQHVGLSKTLSPVQDTQHREHVDENTSLLSNNDQAVLVDWYGEDDPDVSLPFSRMQGFA